MRALAFFFSGSVSAYLDSGLSGCADKRSVGWRVWPERLSGQQLRRVYSHTVAYVCNRYVDTCNTLFTLMSYFYERGIEWLIEEGAKPEEYRRNPQPLIAGSPLNFMQ